MAPETNDTDIDSDDDEVAPYLRLRQICLVASDLKKAAAEVTEVLGLEICHRDPNVGRYGLANFRFGLEDSKAGWSLTLNLKNAFDKIYYVGGVAPAEVLQFNTAIPGAPRTVSVEGSYRF